MWVASAEIVHADGPVAVSEMRVVTTIIGESAQCTEAAK